MKLKTIIYSLYLTIFVVLHSCCSKEALLSFSTQQFVFLDKSTHENLFFGMSPKYHKDSIFISYNNGQDFQKINVSNNPLDSIITIDYNFVETCLVKFSSSDIDTFYMKYEDISSKTTVGQCKLTATILKSIQFNNNTKQDANYSTALKIYK